ncbi:bidirectional sugar transporter SWEET6b-like [Quercus lobata]|uniref:Bidirectional sugar transporter SWEET n=1 Tax=Quercus lobata TaxID=97700 RepID=A0A7N2QZS7_QUELO|nr:bidirectional sugar transporter SWEET6b-like [Quercus lobata]
MVMNSHSIRNVIGIIGNVISFGLFLSPVPTFYRIITNKAVEDFSPIPYIATVLNCIFWVFYGMPFVHPDSLLVVTINSVGLVLALIYLAIFYTYGAKQKNGRKKVLLGLSVDVIFAAIIIMITMTTLHGTKKRSLMVGVICDIFNVLMYVSPLTVMKQVITTKSVEFMPFYLSLTNFLNGSIWTAYALIQFDIYVLVSNGIGAVSGAAQLILYAIYYRKTPKHNDDAPQKPTQIQLSGASVA